jgi:hypothetical protein
MGGWREARRVRCVRVPSRELFTVLSRLCYSTTHGEPAEGSAFSFTFVGASLNIVVCALSTFALHPDTLTRHWRVYIRHHRSREEEQRAVHGLRDRRRDAHRAERGAALSRRDAVSICVLRLATACERNAHRQRARSAERDRLLVRLRSIHRARGAIGQRNGSRAVHDAWQYLCNAHAIWN